jgi:hypothetical protein
MLPIFHQKTGYGLFLNTAGKEKKIYSTDLF